MRQCLSPSDSKYLITISMLLFIFIYGLILFIFFEKIENKY
jgi:hypothetical protein